MGFLDRFIKRKDENSQREKELRNSADEEPDGDIELPKEVLVKPGGMKHEFLVKPNLTFEDQEKLKRGVLYSSGLARYYKFSIEFKENFKVGKMRVTVSCVEPLVPVERSEKTDFYHDMKDLLSTWMVDALKSAGYSCELYNWSYDKKGF